MTSSGSGTGVPVTTSSSAPQPYAGLPLHRYAQIIEYDEYAFFGIKNPNSNRACNKIWTRRERTEIARYLSQAQNKIEQKLEYSLGKRWVVEERRPYRRNRVLCNKMMVIEAGVQATDLLYESVAVSYAGDPAVVIVTDSGHALEEIVLMHAGTQIQVFPETVERVGTDIEFRIPWSRLVAPAYEENPPNGYNYDSMGIYATHVDVWRIYNSPATQVVFTGLDGQYNEITAKASLYVINKISGIGIIKPIFTECYTGRYSWMQLNYRAGADMWGEAEDAIIMLAHSMLPVEMCGCSSMRMAVEAAQTIPENFNDDRAKCPFGEEEGAYQAWKFTRQYKILRFGAL
jgi:hypothetical protein